ncbi:ATP synthase F1 subunit gamma [Anaerolentibacter hominis]|uniref:ATP synthase F1 subunit gamma n=1 Tax=Anaerolentibacter hominis TaxID=3079009 RepID=UPI0031B89B7A
MASMRDIKRRKESVQSTSQITKAMKLVSTVKLQKARVRAQNSKPYFSAMQHAVTSMIALSENMEHPFLKGNASPKKAVILITSNRGLAGGYNSNVTKLLMESGIPAEECMIFAVGKKGRDILASRGYEIREEYNDAINAPLFSDAAAIGKQVLDAYVSGEVGGIYLLYTEFKNTVSHIPVMEKLLPINREDFSEEELGNHLTFMNFEPAPDEALDMIIPGYINSLIYGGLTEAYASENGARMQAMDSATNNAEEMMDDLALKYNRARQSSITQEITEIVAGAAAIS